MMKFIYIILLISIAFGCVGRGGKSGSKVKAQKTEKRTIPLYDYKVVAVYPHSTSAYTQGLFLYDGKLIESTGEYGHSTLRRVELKTGKVLQQVKLSSGYFGEGAVELNDKIYQLTWRDERVFVYDAKTFKKIKEFNYPGEGWGVATDGELLYLSDGTYNIYKINPETFERLDTITVTNPINGSRVTMLNELEWVEGELWANVFNSDFIVRIDPSSGKVVGIIDLKGILPKADRGFDSEEVLNGVAYDSISKKIYVTGKRWNKLFEIEISEK